MNPVPPSDGHQRAFEVVLAAPPRGTFVATPYVEVDGQLYWGETAGKQDGHFGQGLRRACPPPFARGWLPAHAWRNAATSFRMFTMPFWITGSPGGGSGGRGGPRHRGDG